MGNIMTQSAVLTLHISKNNQPNTYAVQWGYVPAANAALTSPAGPQPTPLAVNFEALRAISYDAAAYGRWLYTALFNDPRAAQAWAQCLANAGAAPLRLQLVIGPDAAELHSLHWETLRNPETDAPLFLGERLWLSRLLPSADFRGAQLRPKGQLTAAVAVANPQGLGQFSLPPIDVAGELARVRAGLGTIVGSLQELTDVKNRPVSLDNVLALLATGPTFFQLVCHGKLDKKDAARLLLADAEGRVAPVLGTEFAQRVGELQTLPLLVILLSCQSAGSAANDALSAVSALLAQAGVPAVIAMQGNLSMDTAAKLLPRFFAELQKDGQIDRALAVARGEVREGLDYWMPVLFSRLKDGLLWEIEPEDVTIQPETEISKAGQHNAPPSLLKSLRETLRQCDEFLSDARLRAVFINSVLRPFADRLPHGNSQIERVDLSLAYLLPLELADGSQVLPLFITTLRDYYDNADARYVALDNLAQKLRKPMPEQLPEDKIPTVEVHVQVPVVPAITPALLAGYTGGIDVKNLIPRPDELKQCQDLLAQHHWVILHGFAGVGKASLAVMLGRSALETGNGYVYEFTAQTQLAGLILALAKFLHTRGQPQFWERFGRDDADKFPIEERLAQVLEALHQQTYWLCLLNVQHLSEDAEQKILLTQLAWALKAGQLQVILTSERTIKDPYWATACFDLPGMGVPALQAWLTREGLPLNLARALHAATDGNPMVVSWALEALKNADAPEVLLAHLANLPNVQSFLLDTVERGLKPEERQILQTLSVFAEPEISQEALEAVLGTRSLRPTVTALVQRCLLNAIPNRDASRVRYRLNATVRAYYYELLDDGPRRLQHQRAAHYYETSATAEYLGLAAWHYWKGEAAHKATALIVKTFEQLVNQGQTTRLREVLMGLEQPSLLPEQWAEICLLRGYLHFLYGELVAARTVLAQAFWVLRNRALPNRARLLGQLGHYAGRVRLDETPWRARHWLEQGLAWLRAAPDDTTVEQAQLQLRLGMACRRLGQLETALQCLEAALAQLPITDKVNRAVGKLNLGMVYCAQGSLEAGLARYREAEQLYHEIGDIWGEMEAWHNLGYDLDVAGRWAEAEQYYAREETRAKELNDPVSQYYARLGKGVLYLKLGREIEAEVALEDSVKLSKKIWETHHIYPLSSLATLYLQQGRWETATPCLDEVDRLAAQRHEAPGELLSEIHRNRALWHLQQGQLEAAREAIARALEVAQAVGSKIEAGINQRVWGEILAAVHDPKAGQAWAQSLELLVEAAYELARTQLAYGRWLHAQARANFVTLGAARELAQCPPFEGLSV